jgi:hypothetical protein
LDAPIRIDFRLGLPMQSFVQSIKDCGGLRLYKAASKLQMGVFLSSNYAVADYRSSVVLSYVPPSVTLPRQYTQLPTGYVFCPVRLFKAVVKAALGAWFLHPFRLETTPLLESLYNFCFRTRDLYKANRVSSWDLYGRRAAAICVLF